MNKRHIIQATIAQMMDRGENLSVKTKKLQTSHSPWARIEVEVYWVGTV